MIIDCHTHLLPKLAKDARSEFIKKDKAFASLYSSSKAKIASTNDILRYLDDSGIDKAVVFGFPWKDYDIAKRNNDEIWDFHERYPDRIIPFATFSLIHRDLTFRESERTLAGGFAGIGELSMYDWGWSLSDFEALKPCLAMAAYRQVPVMIHVNELVGHNYPGKISVDVRALFKTIKACPDVDLILAHFGGGFFVYSMMPEIAPTMKRVYVDSAAAPFIYDCRIFPATVHALGEDNVLLGTDFPLLGLDRYRRQLDEAGVEENLRAKIMGKNFLKIMNRRLIRQRGNDSQQA